MLFNSYIFILAFLPIVCLMYYLFIKLNKDNWCNYLLLIASLVFYAYAEAKILIILLVMIGSNYLFCRLISTYSNQEKLKKLFLGIGLCSNLAVLFYFKYFNFFIDSVNLVFQQSFTILNIVQPLGLSFIFFQQIAFLVDTSRGEVEPYSFWEYVLFITYFPHISSGPIILHTDLLPELRKKKIVDWDKISSGIYMFVMGLGKKVLIADLLAKAVDWGYMNTAQLNATSALFISVAYSLQIYFDFSGYSDMAIGISRMLLLDLPINFNSPYKSVTILDFWNRWHMTLTRFLTKYLYIPLGGNRKGKVRTYINTLIVFVCSGLWHGASWTFILWGALHGCFMVFTKGFINAFRKIPDFVNRCITLLFVNFTWILFRSGSFETFSEFMKAIIKGEWGVLNENISSVFVLWRNGVLTSIPSWLWAIGWILLLMWHVLKTKNVEEKARMISYSLVSCIGVSIVAIMCVLSFSGVSTFIYSMF